MSVLLPFIEAEIKAQGPITIARYMALALGHADHGYYTTRDPLGVDGDFVTAPEISQMFGEIIGLWAARVWQSLGKPTPVNIVEFGPGRGTLMVDALRATKSLEDFDDATRLWLVETSPVLRAVQKKNLIQTLKTPIWCETFADVGDGPLIVLGNEFFDALPVRQYMCCADGWRERLVGLENGVLAFVLADDVADQSIIPVVLQNRAEPGTVFEDQSTARAVMEAIATRLVTFGGAALFFDYGHIQHGGGETLQAVKAHRFADVLKNPGDQDLTAHVDFEQLSEAAEKGGADVLGPLSQGVFLNRLGLSLRADRLMKTACADQSADVEAAYERLTSPEQMGAVFKVIAIVPPGGGVPPWST